MHQHNRFLQPVDPLPIRAEIGIQPQTSDGCEPDGKTLVRLKQVTPANQAFEVCEEEADTVRAIVKARQQAGLRGQGVVVVGGRL